MGEHSSLDKAAESQLTFTSLLYLVNFPAALSTTFFNVACGQRLPGGSSVLSPRYSQVCVCKILLVYIWKSIGTRSLWTLYKRTCFLFQVRYLLEWMEEDLEDEDDTVSISKPEFCHPLCQCSKCGPAQKVGIFIL